MHANISPSFQQCVKLLAFGPKGYFSSWRTIGDTLISLLGLCYIVWALAVLAQGYDSVEYQVRPSLYIRPSVSLFVVS